MALNGAQAQTQPPPPPPALPGDPAAAAPEPVAAPPAPAEAPPAIAAQAPVQAASTAEVPQALAVLLRQIAFWRAQQQPDRAMRTVETMLQSYPQHPQALAAAFDVAAQLGDRAAMQDYRARLVAVSPNDPQLPRLDSALRAAAMDPAVLREARSLAAAGKADEAVARYKAAFGNGPVPDSLALEYYRTLASTGILGYREALPVLRRLSAASPNDYQLQLAVAEVMTYRELARTEGMERLRALTRQPEVAEQARRSWRLALTWLGPTFDGQDMLNSYLSQFPSDPELEAKREEFRRSLPDEAQRVLLAGYGAFNAGDMATAERNFQQARQMKPQDTEAIVALAAVRKQQGRNAEATALIQEAIRLAPERREELLGGPSVAAAIPQSPSLLARRALQRDDLERADGLARRAAKSNNDGERLQGLVVLAQVALRRNDLPTAEARYREALALRPNMQEALSGLYDVLQRQNRIAEADTLRQQTGLTPWSGTTSVVAARLQEEAGKESDPAKALSLLREAQQADPSSPWIRLDQARLLKDQGDLAGRRQVEQGLLDMGSPDALYAAALIASGDERHAEAAQALERVPVRLRSSDMSRLLNTERIKAEAERLEGFARNYPAQGVGPLVALAARRDGSGLGASEAVQALGRLEQGAAARAAASAAMAANPYWSPAPIIQLAGALMRAKEPEAAYKLLGERLDESRLTDEERRQLKALRTGETIMQAERLSARGDYVAAQARLAPLQQSMPGNASVIAANARLQLAAGHPREARRIGEELLARDPENMEARMVVVYAAMAQGDYRTAQAMTEQARLRKPEDPQLILLSAQLARARGDFSTAWRGVEEAARAKAAEQRAKGEPVSPQLVSSLSATRLGGVGTSDPLVDEIVRERKALKEESEIRFAATGSLRAHSGTAGTGRLTEASLPLEASAPMPGLGGRIYGRVTPVTLDAGSMKGEGAGEFGTNPLTGATPANRDSTRATGVGLQLGYVNYNTGTFLGQVLGDAGTTPIGFRQTNFAGGIEIAPSLTDQLRLRLAADRRAITDSVLSYAGARDEESGRTWGGVMRTSFRGQLELQTGKTTWYAGGSWSMLRGQNVASNTGREIGVGFNHNLIKTDDQDLILGLDLRYAAFDKNLRYYTYGQGGYFSPQSSLAAVGSLQWRQRWGDWETKLGGSLGVQRFRESSSPYFPTDAAMQAALEASGETSSYAGQEKTAVVAGLNAAIEYDLTQQLTLGLSGRYIKSGVWNEGAGLLYARYRFSPLSSSP
ncbi:BCSC C-terminal domain-containing protein [Acetobacteraceae bacterium H6797]|nr:BCSC C-terminal domain-containing protein [Acetobacteraceae bacterium H6797]